MEKRNEHEAMLFVVDAGGSRTRLLVRVGPESAIRMELPSINPSSVGRGAARDTLTALMGKIARTAAAHRLSPEVTGVIASSAVSAATLARWQNPVTDATARAGLSGHVLLTNDVVPLLLGAPLSGSGVVMVAGTGSCVLGAAGGAAVRVGGAEYLGSDEGSAFSLGRMGLVAAVRAQDGRGDRTSILERLEKASSVRIDELARRLAELPYPRTAVADLAPEVTGAWLEDNDPVAADIIYSAVGDLSLMTRSAIRQLPWPAAESWVLTGGVFVGCAAYEQKVRDEIRLAAGGEASITLVPDCLNAGMSILSTDHGSAVALSIEVSRIGPTALLQL